LSREEHNPPGLAVRHKDPSALLVELAGNWLDRTGLPDVSAVEKELSGSSVKVLEFDGMEYRMKSGLRASLQTESLVTGVLYMDIRINPNALIAGRVLPKSKS